MAFKIGDRLRLVARPSHRFPLGSLATVVGDEYGNVVRFIKVKYDHYENICTHYADRFELVDVAPRPFKVGDKVKIVSLDEEEYRQIGNPGWNRYMPKYVKDGKEYTISLIHGPNKDWISFKEIDWSWIASSLVHADGAPAKAVKKPVKKIKKIPNLPIRQELYKKWKDRGFDGICSYAAKAEDNSISFSINQPCHASLARIVAAGKKIKELAYSIRYEMELRKIKEDKKWLKEYKAYVHYILNESPWAPAFLTKRLSTAMRYDILMDVSKSRHQIAGACIALREGSEFRDKAPMFYKMLKKGFSGHTAFLMSFAFTDYAKGLYCFQYLARGHCVLTGYAKTDKLIEFFKSGYTLDKDEKPFSEAHGVYEVQKWITPITYKEEDTFSKWLDANAVYHKVGNAWNEYKRLTEEELFATAEKIEQLFKEVK